jgi:hypothetical protein
MTATNVARIAFWRPAPRALAIGTGIFLVLAPVLAVARQASLLGIGALVGAIADLLETWLLPLLPVDPVYGGAGLRLLGGIEPAGLAVAGLPGAVLHQILPAIFLSPTVVAEGAAVSALVTPGVTVLARVLAALLATAVLIAVASACIRRTARPSLVVVGRLAQIWLLLDLAHETDLSVRDLEATGLPFALAALAPVDAHGQRTLITTYLDAVPGGLIGIANAVLAVIACLLVAVALLGVSNLVIRTRRKLDEIRRSRHAPLSSTLPHPSIVGGDRAFAPLSIARGRMSAQVPSDVVPQNDIRAPQELASRRIVAPRSGWGWGLPRRVAWTWSPLSASSLPNRAALLLVAVVLSISPFRYLAEGETAILLGTSPLYDDDVMAAPAPVAIEPEPPTSLPAAAESTSVPLPSAAPPDPVPTAQPTPASGRSVVAVEGKGYQYTLRVNGRPTVVRGMGYNPWYAELPTDQRQMRYRRDFSAMREAGVNTLEGWFQWQFDEVTLDEADRQNLKVILPFELNQDYDYADPAVKAMFREQVTAWVLRYRDHSALLMWGPGNEVMHRLIFPTAVQGQRDPAREKRADDFAAFYVELIDMIHELDPHHPVVYRDAEDLYFGRMRAALLKDGKPRPWFIYGTNVYTQRLAEVIERWPMQGLDAPLLVSEFSPGGAGAAERPNMLGWYWSIIRAHPKRVLGGVVYTWATRGPEDLDRVFGLTDESGAPVDGSIAALTRLFHEDALAARAPK